MKSMLFNHPPSFIPATKRRWLFFIFILFSISCYLVFIYLDPPVRTSAAPSGVVSFELGGSVENTRAMLESWNEKARLNIAFGLGFDFVFMPVYSIALSLGVLLASSRRQGNFWTKLGSILGWGAFLAVAFDVVENIALFTMLGGQAEVPFPQLAAVSASIKFSLLIFGVVYGLAGWLLPEKR